MPPPDSIRPHPAELGEFRAEMPISTEWAYFDHAAVAPISGPARRAVEKWADEAALRGDVAWPGWDSQVENTRDLAARLLRAQREEIALVHNTTEGVSLVAEGYPWRRGDNVVTLANEFPSNQYPWLNLADRGVEVRRLPVDDGRVELDRIAAACDERTRIVAVSWIGYASGWRNDVDQLAAMVHDRGALLFLDAIQGLGVFPLDLSRTPVDFLAADGHKWMLAPEGAGILFVRRKHLDRLRATGVGWHSVAHAHDFTRIELVLKDSAARFEGGSANAVGLIALGASLRLLERFGQTALSQGVVEVTDLACRRLAEIGAVVVSDRSAEHCSGIVSFETPGQDPQAVRRRCLQRKVVLSCRAGRLRISPHAYNNAADVERLVEAIRREGCA